MRHKVETSHEQNHIYQKKPVPLQGNFSFRNKRRSNITLCLTDGHSLVKGGSLGQHESEDDDEHRRASTEPEQRAPSMGRGIDKTTSEDCSKKISKGVSLLQHTGDNTSSSWGAILEGSGGCVTVKTTHSNTKERSAAEELLVGLGETSALQNLACRYHGRNSTQTYQFQNNEQNVVDHKGPLSSISVCCQPKDYSSHRPQHQHKSDTPSNIRIRNIELSRQVGNSQADGEEIESIPGLPCISE